MDFKKGGELFQHLRKKKRFNEKQAKLYTAQVILAFCSLHARNIVYRDLKPENILLDEKGNVCLTDFGMSRIMDHKHFKSYSIVGSAEYLSPEIVSGNGHSFSTDYWSLGILLFELLYGQPPFYNQNQAIMFNLIKNNPVRFYQKPEISENCKNFILNLL